ncbi:uncharacterized protein LOC105790845 [Gossypium raimondii]|uniref:uncharacterized protein LOC105790845 n=1 Tax=Gossypium raimondii TaxID=29730 RepID=UPI00063B0305|nr:uncharacterized protein LOC105790845 [Gossypium raimondii]
MRKTLQKVSNSDIYGKKAQKVSNSGVWAKNATKGFLLLIETAPFFTKISSPTHELFSFSVFSLLETPKSFPFSFPDFSLLETPKSGPFSFLVFSLLEKKYIPCSSILAAPHIEENISLFSVSIDIVSGNWRRKASCSTTCGSYATNRENISCLLG